MLLPAGGSGNIGLSDMQTLLELLPIMKRLGGREAASYSNGYRTWRLSYAELYEKIAGISVSLSNRHLGKGDRLILWGENRLQWLTLFWACLSRGVEVVPIDPHFSEAFVKRIQERVQARLLVHSEGLPVENLNIEKLSFGRISEIPAAGEPESCVVEPDDVVEIVFTSGTTGEPKGVVHRHRNICANLRPFKREIDRYLWLARPFQPLRILELLPLSHMFGQAMGVFIPLLLQGAVVFMTELHPGAAIEICRRHRVSVLSAVPRQLRNIRGELERREEIPAYRPRLSGVAGILQRWWKYRRIHARLGWKFWAVVSGGALLSGELESFWSRLGYLVVQGYGMTEASPVITVNHPFRSRRGSIGKPLEGQEVKIAADGEILVRGPSVVTEYLGQEPGALSEGGWLHTGDVGSMDEEGRLYYKGRKKDVIVTEEGLNVFPEDVESALKGLAGVREAVVLGLPRNGAEQVEAVLILDRKGIDPEKLVREANRRLETHQRIKGWSVWSEEDFPRTASTSKVIRSQIKERILRERPGAAMAAALPVEPAAGLSRLNQAIAAVSGSRPRKLEPNLKLAEDLGLSSLERVELLSRLEAALGVRLSEDDFSRLQTIGEVQNLLEEIGSGTPFRGEKPGPTPEAGPRASAKPAPRLLGVDEEEFGREPAPLQIDEKRRGRTQPRWNRRFSVRLARALFQDAFMLPLFRHFLKLATRGTGNLAELQPPVIFAANHASHLDTLAILAALPRGWRRRLAPAVREGFFRPFLAAQGFSLKERLRSALYFLAACGLFNAYPLPQHLGRIRSSLQYTGELVDRGYCPLIFPEGMRTPDGQLKPFQAGVGLFAVHMLVPVVPIYIEGLYEVLSIHHDWPKRGSVTVHFGSALDLGKETDYRAVARRVEDAVKHLAQRSGPADQ